MNVRNRIFLLGAFFVAGVALTAIFLQKEVTPDLGLPEQITTRTTDSEVLEKAPQIEDTKKDSAENVSNLMPTEISKDEEKSVPSPYLHRVVKSAKQKRRSELPAAAQYPPLPDSPFLAQDTKLETIPTPIERNPASETLETPTSSLSWFRIDMGTVSQSQKQEDSVFNDSRTVTNPLSLLLSLGAQLTETVGLEFSWGQGITSSSSSSKSLPKNQLLVGLAWQPKSVVKASSFTRWSFGLSLEDAAVVTGEPTKEKLTNYTKTDLYAGINHNRHLSGLWYLDIKLLLTLSPIKPQEFLSYTDNSLSLDITPQYELDQNLRVGLNLGLSSKRRRGELYNYQGNKDSLSIENQEFRAGVSISFTF